MPSWKMHIRDVWVMLGWVFVDSMYALTVSYGWHNSFLLCLYKATPSMCGIIGAATADSRSHEVQNAQGTSVVGRCSSV